MNKNIIEVIFQSLWSEGTIETNAKLDLTTGIVFDIELSDDGDEFEHLICEGIIYNDEYYGVEINDVDNEYYMDVNLLKEFKENHLTYEN